MYNALIVPSDDWNKWNDAITSDKIFYTKLKLSG